MMSGVWKPVWRIHDMRVKSKDNVTEA